MAKSKYVIEAEKKAKAVFDRILDCYEDFNFVEITASVGGDVVVRRYYHNGKETDR